MRMIQNKMPAAWQAKWINPELSREKEVRQPSSVLRRRFLVEHKGNAVLYITCHGLYEAVLNGNRVGNFVLAPGTGDYAKRLTVQAYDISDLLNESMPNRFCAAMRTGKPARTALRGKTISSRGNSTMPGWKLSVAGTV